MRAALERAAWVAREVQQDCERDAAGLDGKEFNGRNVAEIFGQTLAMVSALGHVIEDLVTFLDRELP